ncbi:hypothetical protein CH368_07705 [Leptospira levettii]|nr:hypothetical protein CH368_07705 [Leptospira levettii]
MVATYREREAIFLRTGCPKSRVGRAEVERPGRPKTEVIPADTNHQTKLKSTSLTDHPNQTKQSFPLFRTAISRLRFILNPFLSLHKS